MGFPDEYNCSLNFNMKKARIIHEISLIIKLSELLSEKKTVFFEL